MRFDSLGVVAPSDSAAGGSLDVEPKGQDDASERNPEKHSGEDPGKQLQGSSLALPDDVLAQFGSAGMPGGPGIAARQAMRSREEQLMDIIQIAVMPESWEDVGGPGTIGEFDGMIVVRHSPRAHRQIEQVLHMLRDASSQQGWENPGGRFPSGTGGGLGGGGFF